NVQMSLATADMAIAAEYAALTESPQVGRRIFTKVRKEYERTVSWLLRVSRQRRLLDNNPVIQRSIELRNPYVDPMSHIQVKLLRMRRKLRGKRGPKHSEVRELTSALHSSINGIAAALKNTG
ncbi:MAG: phosphoenolpyruvate carboxylase, partial [Nitrospinota bacterium]